MPLTLYQKRVLLTIARTAIEEYINSNIELDVDSDDPELSQIKGAFVTLHKNNQLRGCVGNIIGYQPLYLTVRSMAIAAASQDPRFKPVERNELKKTELEISVLSQPRVIESIDEIALGTHGVIVEKGVLGSGVFLPQVATETGWSKEEFLSHLCSGKAGLAPDAWKKDDVTIKIFSAEVFSEKDTK